MTLRTEPVSATGTRTVQTLHGPAELPTYPAVHELAGRLFRAALRDHHRLTPSEAAARLGIPAIEVYELLRGARSCDWGEAQRLLLAGKAEKEPT